MGVSRSPNQSASTASMYGILFTPPSSRRLIADVRACSTARALVLALVFLVITPI